MKKTNMVKMAVVAIAVFSAVAAQGAVVLKNADWATATLATNGMEAAHGHFPAGLTSFTVEAWVKPTANIPKSNNLGNWIYANMKGSDAGRFIFLIHNGRLGSFHATPRDWPEATGSAGVIPLNEWTHVAMARTPSSIKFYVNGAFVSETNAVNNGTFRAAPPDGAQTIGNQHSGIRNGENAVNDRVFQGSISDLRVWTVERTAEEIAANYAKRLRGNEANLFTYVPFTDAHDGIARNWADGFNLVVPPQYQLVEDAELDAKITEAPRLPPLVQGRPFRSHFAKIAVTADVQIARAQFTVETWMRPTGAIRANPVYWMGQYVRNDPGWLAFGLLHNSRKPCAFIGNSAASRAYAAGGNIPLDEWTHVAISRDNGTVKVYTNGLLSATCTVNSQNATALPPDAPLVMAAAAPGDNDAWDGDLREVRVWNCVRTDAQIAEAFDHSLTGKEEGLIGYWPMDEGCGTNLFNKVTGVPAEMGRDFTWVPDCYFHNGNQASSIETSVRLTDDFTLESWVRVANLPIDARGYIMGQWTADRRPSWVTLSFDWSPGRPGLRIGSDDATTNSVHFFSAGDVRTNEWFHVAATREGSAVKVYMNGRLVKQGVYACDDPMPAANLRLFALNGSLGFVGDTCEMRAWNRARTAEEIAGTMHQTLTGQEDGLVGYWPCTQAPGSAILQGMRPPYSRHSLADKQSFQRETVPLLRPLPEAARMLATSFDGGRGDVVRTGVGIDVQDFTFETWVYLTAHPFFTTVDDTYTYLFSQYRFGGDNHRFLIGLNNRNRFGAYIGGADTAGNPGGWRTSSSEILLNRWTHLAATREGSTLLLYVNGALDATFENFSTLSPWSETAQLKLTLGGTDDDYWIAYSRMMHGAMREARVWNRACSAAEIAANYRSKLHGTEAGLIGYWPLTETSGNVLTNACRRSGVPAPSGFMIAGWDYVDALELADPPMGTLILVR